MPSTSKKQANFMAAIAHNPAFAKKVGVSQSVGKDFNEADKGRKFKEGGSMKKLFGGKETFGEELKEAKAVKSKKITPAQFVKGEKSEGHKEENSSAIAKKIASGKMSPKQYATKEATEKYARGGGIESKGKTQGKMIKMNRGGRAC